MTLPTLTLEAAFTAGASTSTWLHLDAPARGKRGTGTRAGVDAFVDISDRIRSGTVRRVHTRVAGPIMGYQAGTMTVELNNRDRALDPTNLSGPYVSAGLTQVTPMRAVRLRATWNGTTYDLFRGYADSWLTTYPGPNDAVCTLTATDGIKVLSNHDRVAGGSVGAGEDSGARVTRILNSIGWSATDRVIAVGDSTLAATTLEGNAWAELQLVADSELGEVYIDAAGRVVFRNRLAALTEARSNTSQATFGESGSELRYSDIGVDYDDSTLANLVRAGRPGGTTQTAEDTESQDQYLTHTYSGHSSDLLLQTDAAAASWANYMVYQSKDPELRFDKIVIKPRRDPTNLFPEVLGRQFGDRITVKRSPPGGGTITRDCFIRGVEHQGSEKKWQTSFVLQSATKYAFLTLNNSVLGKLNENALAY